VVVRVSYAPTFLLLWDKDGFNSENWECSSKEHKRVTLIYSNLVKFLKLLWTAQFLQLHVFFPELIHWVSKIVNGNVRIYQILFLIVAQYFQGRIPADQIENVVILPDSL